MAPTLPGVKVGPLDPDATSGFGRVSQRNSARQLIRLHAQAHPAELTRQLARPLDEPRTKGLDLEEVSGFLSGLERDDGDPLVPEGAKIVGAQVRGKPDSGLVLTFTYRTKSGRTAKWFAPYAEKHLPESFSAGDELTRIHEIRERGMVAWDDQGNDNERLRREAAGLRREVAALRGQLETGGESGGERQEVEEVPETEGDTRPDNQIVAEAEQLRRENEELRSRLTRLEGALDERVSAAGTGPDPDGDADDDDAGAGDTAPDDDVASASEPVEGYDNLNAEQAKHLLRSDDIDADTKQRILKYEQTHANRRSVLGVAHQALDPRRGE